MAYVCHSVPLITVVDGDSSLARLVRENDIGRSVVPGNAEVLAEAIRSICDKPDLLERLRINAERFGRENYTASVVLPKWSALFSELEAE